MQLWTRRRGGALDARDEALRELDALRVEHDTKDSQLRSLIKELRERERAAEDEAVDAKETEDCIEAAQERIAELEKRLAEARETSQASSVATLVANAIVATADE